MERKEVNSKTKEQIFWNWFTAREQKYFNYESDRENSLDSLAFALNIVNPNLAFELGPLNGDSKRELVISANGIKSHFAAVNRLVKYAPKFDNWVITAFRQPRPEFTQLNFNGIDVDMKDVYFRYMDDEGKIAIELNIKGYRPNVKWDTVSFILLDLILGEHDTEMFIGGISRKALNPKKTKELCPIAQLPKVVKEYKTRISN